jgi:CDP-6-deoxy-D-xylo-4-hexulose-3-dehydrase
MRSTDLRYRRQDPHFQRALKKIGKVLQDYYSRRPSKFEPGKTRIPLARSLFGAEEALVASDAILSNTATMGERVTEFERRFARYLGVSDAIMTNSGSSANLLALSAAANPHLDDHLRPGDEIITPAVTWATTLYPILNVGATPVIVDIDPDTFNIDIRRCREAISNRTKAILPVHLLGNPCEITEIVKLASQNDLFLIEDCCEAHGAVCNGQKVGSFGDFGTFSFYFSHHISTVEGGMVVTDDQRYAELLRGLRAFGWIRDLRDPAVWEHSFPEIDPRFMFVNIGFNVRPTDIQGGFGLHQLPKLEREIAIRRENAAYFEARLSKHGEFISTCKERADTLHVRFGFAITVKPGSRFGRKTLTDFLESRGIETRPIMAGNIAEQPVLQRLKDKVRIAGPLDSAHLVHCNSFFFGNHSGIGKSEREYVADCFDEFFELVD